VAVNLPTESATPPAVLNPIQWPPYAKKLDLLADLQGATGAAAVADIIQRLSNTDTAGWSDGGSHIGR
jgi:hypothetical protein